MNTLMIPATWISKKLRMQTQKTPKWLGNGYFARAALAVSVAAMLLPKRFLYFYLPIPPIWLGIAVLVALRYQPKVFHNLIGPLDALLKLFGRSPKPTKRVDKAARIGCGLYEKACPSRGDFAERL